MKFSRLLKNQWDRFAAAGAVLLGLVAIILGWHGVSDKTLATEQLPYLASGLGLGLFLLGVGATLWLSADLRDTWRKLHDVHRALQGQEAPDQAAAATDAGAVGASAFDDRTSVTPAPPAEDAARPPKRSPRRLSAQA